MGSKDRTKIGQSYSDPYEDYEDMEAELDADTDDVNDLPGEFNGAGRTGPSTKGSRLSTRRKIERLNELKELHQQFDDWDDLELGSDW